MKTGPTSHVSTERKHYHHVEQNIIVPSGQRNRGHRVREAPLDPCLVNKGDERECARSTMTLPAT